MNGLELMLFIFATIMCFIIVFFFIGCFIEALKDHDYFISLFLLLIVILFVFLEIISVLIIFFNFNLKSLITNWLFNEL